ncbi:hypothetical protein M5K25_022045 [Dendrobium thyrsiflorum]|uniref:Uncharacterized protein n=1 Tax=Dendrobium thyrsiflorum TaxID=117978 RepID=A0ABD0UBC5_DENTH
MATSLLLSITFLLLILFFSPFPTAMAVRPLKKLEGTNNSTILMEKERVFYGREVEGCMPRELRVPPSAPSRYGNDHTLGTLSSDSLSRSLYREKSRTAGTGAQAQPALPSSSTSAARPSTHLRRPAANCLQLLRLALLWRIATGDSAIESRVPRDCLQASAAPALPFHLRRLANWTRRSLQPAIPDFQASQFVVSLFQVRIFNFFFSSKGLSAFSEFVMPE